MDESVILKVKLIGEGGHERGCFLHKTGISKSLKDVAFEILTGQNPCFDVPSVTNFLGFDMTDTDSAEFDTVVETTVEFTIEVIT